MTTKPAKRVRLRHRKRHGREGLVDLDALQVSELPSGPLQRLPDGRDRAETEHARFNGRDAV
jgi:hypothetical protein